ncbi:hypothetical protein AVEN_269290-1 [Araneus ventricosus]|uniref:Uncharacterized protein n=1 Tax=Araneus ventricosus TaxID=182803 RepID=A0A4Y2L4J1_ARAVE|nr:hypothetical protein AVEN_269290-1 [Araneus ventricosus]
MPVVIIPCETDRRSPSRIPEKAALTRTQVRQMFSPLCQTMTILCRVSSDTLPEGSSKHREQVPCLTGQMITPDYGIQSIRTSYSTSLIRPTDISLPSASQDLDTRGTESLSLHTR